MMKLRPKVRGIIASAKEKSRNGKREYTEKFWDNIFNSDIFKEGIKHKVYFGELWHPDNDDDYGQIHADPNKAAIVLTKVEKKGLEYFGEFEILPTPAGETYQNLMDMGCIFGVSSRGYSEFETDYFDDASIFDLITWDLVAFPGIESCRLYPMNIEVSESFNKKKNKVKIKENLDRLSNTDEFLHDYISETLIKITESTDSKDVLNITDTDDVVTIKDSKDDVSIHIIKFRDNIDTEIYFDDGVNGKKQIAKRVNLESVEPNDEFLVENLYYNKILDKYDTKGKWEKIIK